MLTSIFFTRHGPSVLLAAFDARPECSRRRFLGRSWGAGAVDVQRRPARWPAAGRAGRTCRATGGWEKSTHATTPVRRAPVALLGVPSWLPPPHAADASSLLSRRMTKAALLWSWSHTFTMTRSVLLSAKARALFRNGAFAPQRRVVRRRRRAPAGPARSSGTAPSRCMGMHVFSGVARKCGHHRTISMENGHAEKRSARNTQRPQATRTFEDKQTGSSANRQRQQTSEGKRGSWRHAKRPRTQRAIGARDDDSPESSPAQAVAWLPIPR